jgi:hypothetical protein
MGSLLWNGVAEGVGFEPTVGFPTLDFESSALNRTQPPFHFARWKLGAHYQASRGVCKTARVRWNAVSERNANIIAEGTNFVNLPAHLYARQNEAAKPHFFFGIVFGEVDPPIPFEQRRCPARAPNTTREGRSVLPKKCYNFRLAMAARVTAYCVSAGQATLLLGVDRNSQVVSAAVH